MSSQKSNIAQFQFRPETDQELHWNLVFQINSLQFIMHLSSKVTDTWIHSMLSWPYNYALSAHLHAFINWQCCSNYGEIFWSLGCDQLGASQVWPLLVESSGAWGESRFSTQSHLAPWPISSKGEMLFIVRLTSVVFLLNVPLCEFCSNVSFLSVFTTKSHQIFCFSEHTHAIKTTRKAVNSEILWNVAVRKRVKLSLQQEKNESRRIIHWQP